MNYQPLSPFIYKTIWSFFFNKVNKDVYKEIKNISLDYVDAGSTTFGTNVVFMSLLLQNIIAKWRSGTIDYYFSVFVLFKKLGRISSAQVKKIKERLREYDYGNFSIDSAYNLINLSIKSKNINISFFYFVLCQTMLCKIYNRLAIFNHDLFDILISIKNKNVKIMVFKTIIKKQFFSVQQDLKKSITTYCLLNKNEFENRGISHLWLFGSINDNQYHDNSDIDMIVDFNEEYVFKDAYMFLSIMLFKQFGRKSDLHLFSSKKDIVKKTNAFLIF